MSKILQAMNRGGGVSDLSVRLGSLGGVEVRPLPPGNAQPEFANLANTLLTRAGEQGRLVLAFAATSRGEGATYVSFNVARHLAAMLDRRIAWVDADFEHPEPKLRGRVPGLREMLADPELVPEVLGASGNLVVVPNGVEGIKPANLLMSPAYHDLLEAFRKNFFMTIIDSPAVLSGTEVTHLADPTDGLVLVVQSGRLKHEVVNHGLKTLTDQGVKIIGTVLNRRTFAIPRILYEKL